MSIDRFAPAMDAGVHSHPKPTQTSSSKSISLSQTALPLRLLGILFVLLCLLLPVSARAVLTINSLTLSPSTVVGGTVVTGTVTLSANTTANTDVTLASNNTTVAPVPAKVTVLNGTSSNTFTFTTTAVTAATTVTITATLGTSVKTATLIVNPPLLSAMTITPTTLVGGADAIGTVTLSGNAPAGGLLVTLTSSSTTLATVPPVVRVLAGTSTATFLTATSPVAAGSSVTITGKLGAGTAIADPIVLQVGTTQTNNSTADAAVQPGSNASTNFGTLTTLRIANFGATNAFSGASYLKFDLTGVTAAPQFSTLKLSVNTSSTPSTGIAHIKIYGVSDTTWTETGLTWNNAPGLDRTNFVGTGTLITEADVPMSGGVASFDVSSYVTSHIGSVIGLQAISETNNSLKLFVNSREATTGKPILVMASSGARLLDVPAPAWAKATIGTDTIDTGGPSSGDGVVLGSGVYENDPGPDAVARNPVGPSPVFSRAYRTWNAYNGYASPGLPVGWTHNYDVTVKTANNTTWSALTLIYPDHASEVWTPVLTGGGAPTGAFNLPAKTPYIVTGVASTTTGLWNSLTITFKDESKWTFSSNPNTTNAYALTNIANLAGRSVGLYYDASSRLTDCKDDITPFHTLLHLDYANGSYLSLLTEYSDPANPRKIDYGVGTQNTTTVLTSVSQMYTGATPIRQDWKYSYLSNQGNGTPFISNVFVYDPAGSGNYVNNTIGYDTVGRVSGLTDASAKSHNYTYPAQTQVTVQDVSGVALQWFQGFDALDKNTGDTDANTKSSSVLYGDTNPYLATQVTNRNGQLVNATYDNYGSLTSIDEPVNDSQRLVTQTGYLYTDFALGRADHVTVGAKSPTSMTYHTGSVSVNGVPQPNGMVKTVSTPKPDTVGSASVVTTTYVYTALGNVASVMSPSPVTTGTTVTTTYNYVVDGTVTKVEALGEPLTVTDPNGHTTHLRYDARGNVTAMIDASGNETDYIYNYLDQVTKVTYPPTVAGGGRAYLLYLYTFSDNTGPLKSTQLYNEAGVLERQSSRTAGSENETKKVSGSTEAATTTFDSLYRPSMIADGNGKTHLSTYNAIGQLSQFAFPNYNAGTGYDSVNTTGFDNDHNVTAVTDGNAKSFTFDIASLSTGDSRLKASHYPAVGALAAFDATYTYDGYGRVTNLVYGGDTYAYTYDDNDLVLTETDTYAGLPARVLSYTYNDNGSRASMNIASLGLTYTYTYDSGGRLKVTSYSWGDSTNNSYLSNNWISAQYNGIIDTNYFHNARGWLSNFTNTYRADGTSLSFANTFTYDALGNMLSYYQEMAAVYTPTGAAAGFTGTITYAYDPSIPGTNQDRLTSESSSRTANGSSHNNLLVNFTFAHTSDPADNLTTLRGTTLTYNFDNQLSPGATYDGQGNPTLYNWAGVNTTFAWDAEDRLTSFGTAFTAGYRPDGLRAWKQTGSASTRHYFLYDGGHIVAELDSAGALLSAYGWGAAGLSERYEKATGLVFAYTFDPSGNLLQRHTNNTANGGTPIYADYSTLYDSFGGQRGAVTSRSGFALVNQDPVGWSGQFGGYTDQETVTPPGAGTDPLVRYPLVLLGHRYYDPGAGRFLNRDPEGMEGGINVYAYCTNNPVNHADPLGLDGYGLGGWIDHHLLGDSIEHWGEVQGRYDAGRATKRELAFAAINGSVQTVLLAVTIVDGGVAVKGAFTFVAKKVAARAAAKAAIRGALKEPLALYEPTAFRCMVTRAAAGNALESAKISYKILKAQDVKQLLSYTARKGLKRATVVFSKTGYHEAVMVNGRVYDAITGVKGLPYKQWVKKLGFTKEAKFDFELPFVD